ncbi:MAG TPA: FtsH protease activity modulator HflK [Candidatus Marinimicrobia bacterium]|nr:FtsH protease activity modulator HflK [Candidatus Neomarinimicrobiota bacterium]
MSWKRIKIGKEEFEIPAGYYYLIVFGILLVMVGITIFMSFYTVDANEVGVVLRFGKFQKITYPGLHLKLPWGIDKVYTVKVDYQYKEEFGFRTVRPGVKTQYNVGSYTSESWMLTGDLNIADVKWVVQYKIKDAFKFLFRVRNVSESIRDVAEAAMRLVVGDRSFHEVLQSDRIEIANLVRDYMQKTLDLYDAGIDVQLVQLKDVHPPDPVRDSFNEVNRAKQEQERMVNEAMQVYNREIYRVEGEADRLIREAEGYRINRINRAKGEAALFNAVFNEYLKAKEVTKKRLYLETIEDILSKVKRKYIIDKDLQNVLPLLNLQSKERVK